jgi:hypothetical protein
VKTNSKHQAPNSKQAPMTKIPMTETRSKRFCLEHWDIGAWNLFGIWDLVLGA